MKTVRFLLPAEQEMLEAAQYYASQEPGLGQDFMDAIESAAANLAEEAPTLAGLACGRPQAARPPLPVRLALSG